MKQAIKGAAVVGSVWALDRVLKYAIRYGYEKGLREGHKRGHACVIAALAQSRAEEEQGEGGLDEQDTVVPMHTEN